MSNTAFIAHRDVKLAIVAAAMLLIWGCSKPAELPALSHDATILAFGNSLTAGIGSSRDKDYPSVLKQLIGREVVNAGVPGEISSAGLNRLPTLLEAHHPELLVLIHGGNDLLRKLDTTQTRANLAAMIELANAHGVSVVLLGIPKPGIFLRSADFYAELADEWNVPIDDEVLTEILSNNKLKSDHIHPNDSGYRLMAEAVRRLLTESGAL